MGELTLAAPVAGLTGKGRITADDVLLCAATFSATAS